MFTINRIEVAIKKGLFDAQGHIDAQKILNTFGLDFDVEYRKIFTEDLDLMPEDLAKLARELSHPVTHSSTIGQSPAEDFDYIIEVGYKPGVMDPEGRSTKILAEDVHGKTFPFEKRIAVQHQRLIRGEIPAEKLEEIAGLFANDTVQSFKIWKKEDWNKGIKPYVPTVTVPQPEPVQHYDLNAQFGIGDFLDRHSGMENDDDKDLENALDKLKEWVNTVKNHFRQPNVDVNDYFKRDIKKELGEVGFLPKLLPSEFETALNWASISSERSLALNIAEMNSIKDYYNKPEVIEAREKVGLSPKATDVELELFGQTWSEHCKHKIFNADVDYTAEGVEERIAEGIFSRYIKSSTFAVKEMKQDFIKSVLWDNSGVVDLDESLKHYLCFKCETHNSPSFMEPYGGAITGIVGVYRDPMGTGKGSMITFGVWGYCTGSIFYDGKLRPPLHPDQLLDGIHIGVRDGGNKHGVPTAIGGTFFDDGYLGKCLVYVGAGGLIPKEIGSEPGYEKTVNPGDRVICVGGRVGKDGIHGATASSEEYHEGTPAGHVQIGDPYTQKNVQEFILEALAENLINYSQDSGAGGVGSAAGEMAEVSGGAELELSNDLFKYSGLAPWEMLESESQERMFLAVSPGKLEKLIELAEKWNVEWRDLGEFNDSGYFHVKHKGETVCYLDIDFLHNGVPQKKLKAEWLTPEERGLKEPDMQGFAQYFDYVKGASPDKRHQTGTLHRMLKRENIASKEFLQREYDTRVQGRTIIPAFIGDKSDVPSDAFVQRIEFDKDIGAAVGIGLNPSLSKIDTYDMAQYAANEGLMRVVAVGADPDKAANNGNYCWPGVLPDESDESEYKMAQLVRAAQGQHDFAMATGVATISGKDSMKIQGNIPDEEGNKHRVYGLPSLQFATVAKVSDISKCVTSDFKQEGDLIYMVGLPTNDELGASEFYEDNNATGKNVPFVDASKSMECYRSLHKAMQEELVESAKVCSKGGMAVALAQAAFAGGLGAKVHLDAVPTEMDKQDPYIDVRLQYSESASRFVVSVARENKEKFEETMDWFAKRIGTVQDKNIEMIGVKGKQIINHDAMSFKKSWQSTFEHKMYRGDEQ